MDKIEFGKYLRELRDKKGLTTRQVEISTGISNSYISLLENGKREIPSPDVLKKLAKAYTVLYEDLMYNAGYIKEKIEYKIEEELPDELKELGVEYLIVTKELKNSGLSPDDIRKIIDFAKGFKKI